MSARPSIRCDEHGFSLIEVLIAVAILGIVALGIAGLFSHSILVNASGYDYAVLSSVARQSLEQMQAMPFLDAALVETTPGSPSSWPDPTGTNRFQIQYTVTDYRVDQWPDVAGAPAGWPAPDTGAGEVANLKRISMLVRSTNQNLPGIREFVVAALKVPKGG